MRIPNFLHSRVLAIAVAMAVVPAAIPSNVPIVGVSKAEARDFGHRYYRHGARSHHRGFYRGGRHYGRPAYGSRYHGRRHYGGRHYRHHRRYNDGVGIGAAIIGLGVGAAIANSGPRYYREPAYGHAVRSPEWYRYCAARYRSFDPRSGTFQPYNGPRRLCR
jgi:hypothetical protein